MVLLEFTKKYKAYNEGDLAVFNEDLASRLIEAGCAVKAKPPKKKKPTSKKAAEDAESGDE